MPPLFTSPPLASATRLCPPGSWDVHHHIFELDRFPLSPTRHFTPSPAPLPAFEAFQRGLGIDHACIAHGLAFGTDPSSLLAYMEHFEGTARAYACVNIDTITDGEIKALQAKGIIGIRIDLHLHHAQHNLEEQKRLLQRYAARVGPLGWGLQIYHPHPEYYDDAILRLVLTDELAPIIRNLNVSLVVDHFGALKTASLLEYQKADTSSFDATSQPGLAALCGLLREEKIWIKLSAPYRCSKDPTYGDMKPLVRALVNANPDRVLYGSDWPHTQPFHRRPANLKGTDVETYLPFDDAAWVRTMKDWLNAEEYQKLMVDNPRRFTGYDAQD